MQESFSTHRKRLFFLILFMKKFLWLSVVVFSVFSCAKKEGNLYIRGEIKGLTQGRLYIQQLQDTILKPIQVVRFDGNSEFETHLTIEEPEVLYLYLDRGISNSLDNNIAFFAEKGKMSIYSEVDNFIDKAKITGNKNQELWNDYQKVITKYSQKNLDYIEQRLLATYNNQIEQADSLERLESSILKNKYLYTINFCVNNAAHEIAPYIAVTEIFDAHIKYLDTIYNSLSESVKTSRYGQVFAEHLEEIKQ